MKKPDFEVERIYRVRFGYWFEMHDSDKESDAILKVSAYAKKMAAATKFDCVELSNTGLGPHWEAYFVIESLEEKAAVALAKLICAYIKRFKGWHITEV